MARKFKTMDGNTAVSYAFTKENEQAAMEHWEHLQKLIELYT